MHISDVELNAPQGVYLYLGYSSKDETRLKEVTQLGALEAIGAIQGLVSFHNVNGNKVWILNFFREIDLTKNFVKSMSKRRCIIKEVNILVLIVL